MEPSERQKLADELWQESHGELVKRVCDAKEDERRLRDVLIAADDLLLRGDGVLYITADAWRELMAKAKLVTTHNMS